MTERPDPVLEELRARVTATDEAILELVNRRLELVREIKRHKLANGLDLLDPERERRLLEHLQATNQGPLSRAGVADLLRELLELTKREIVLRADDSR